MHSYALVPRKNCGMLRLSREEFNRSAGRSDDRLVEVGKLVQPCPLRLLACGVDGDRGASARCGASLGSAHDSHLPASSSSAEKLIAAIGLEPRYDHFRRHLERLQNRSCSGIDSPQIAFVTFPSAVPELSVYPRDSSDEAVGLDRTKNFPCLGIDLMNLSISILPHPKRPFSPCEARVTAAAGR